MDFQVILRTSVFCTINNTMAVLLKTASVRVSFIQIMQVRVQNRAKVFGKVDTLERYQASKADRMVRGIANDLLQMAKRIGLQCEAAEYEDLSGEKSITLDGVVV